MRLPDARLAPIVVLSFVAIAARVLVGVHITDDAYITMRYSRNLLDTGLMSYNPPDPVLGTSTPLWTWILSLAGAMRLPMEGASVGVATAADIGSIVLILTSPVGATTAALVSAATIAAWPAYVIYAVSGMETSLYVLTIVAAVTTLSRGQTIAGAAAAALAALCRPDGAMLVLLGFAWTLVTQSRLAATKFVVVATLILAPWIAYAVWRFGSVVPSSVVAKAAADDPWMLSFQNLNAYFLHGPNLPVTLLALIGSLAIIKAPPLWQLFTVWAWTYVVAMTARNAFTHFPWYFVPLLPVYTGLAARPLELIAARIESLAVVVHKPVAQTALAALLGIALLSRMTPLRVYLDGNAAGRERLYASVASALARVDPACTVAATEIGTIGYHYPGRVLDLVGLVSPEVLGRSADGVLSQSRARWLITYDTHFDRAIALGQDFSALYERRSTVPVTAGRSLEVYERRDRSRCSKP
jgi:hypothetical protein